MTTAKSAGIPRYKTDAYIDYVIYLLLFTYLAVDMYSGYRIVTTNSSGGVQAFKYFFYFLLIVSIAAKDKKHWCFISFCIFLIILIGMHCLKNGSSPVDTMSYPFRIFITFFLFIYYKIRIEKSKENFIKSMDKVFIFTSLVFLANFFMGLAGKGFSSYATGFGIKGFIHNVHLLTGLQMCLVYYILRKIKPRKKFIRILFYTGNTAISFLMGTKTAVIQAFLISFIDFYFSLGKRSKQIVRWFLPVLMGGIVYLLVIFIPQTNFYMNVEKRILSKIGTDNLVNIFLSGRLTQQQFWHSQYIDDISISTIFFGMGYMGGKPMSIPMEIDFFFTLYFCGIIVLAMTLFFYIRLIYFCLQKKNYQLFYFNILYFFMSLTSGYVWMNVLSGVFFSYINAYELSRKK